MSRPDITAYINGNARGYHDALRRVRSDTRATARDAEGAFAAITARLRGGVSSLVGALRGGPGGIAAALGIGSYVAAAKQAVDATLEMGRAARTAGVSFEAFQELRYAAEASQVGVESLSDGLKEMQGRAEAVARTGKGAAREAFAQLGLDAKALAEGLKQPDRMFETIIERMRGLDTASRINVAQQIFGGRAGPEFLGFLEDSARGVAGLRQAAGEGAAGVKTLTQGLAEMQARASDVARTGKGPASAAFQKLGLDAKALAEGLKQPDRMFQTIIERLRGLDGATRVKVAEQIFGGTAARDFLRQIDAGAKGVDALRLAAGEGAAGVKTLTDGLKTMQEQAQAAASAGKGPASAAFQKLGLDAKALAEGLKQPDRMFQTIIERLRALDAASRVKVAEQIFGGTAANDFLRVVEASGGEIARLREEARRLGTVLEDDILKTAEEIDAAFRTIGQSIDGFVRPRVIRLAGDVVTLLEKIMAVESRRSSTLKNEFTALGKERLDNENEILRLREQQGQITGATADLEKRLLDGTIDALKERNRQIEELEKQRLDILDDRDAEKLPRPTYTPSTEDADPVRRAGGGRARATAEIDRQRKAVEDVIAALKEEIALIGLSETEQEQLTALRRAGVEAVSAEGATIMELIARKQRLLDVERQREEAQRRGADAARQWGDTMVGQLERVIDGSFDAREAARMLVKELLRAAATGEGLFASLFSGGGGSFGSLLGGFAKMMFGGGRAGGGEVSPGRIYRVNEYGEEFFSPSSHGRVVPAGGGGGKMHITVGLAADAGLNIMPQVEAVAEGKAMIATNALAARVGGMVDSRSDERPTRGMRS